MTQPKISVMTPIKDRPELIIRAVGSVLTQTFKDFELIVIDDHSKIPVQDILNENYSDERIKIYRLTENDGTGISIGRNKACALARGPIMVIFDSDDIMPQNRLFDTFNVFNNNPDVGVIYGQMEYHLMDGRIITYPHQKFSAKLLNYISFIPNSSSAFRMEAFQKTTGYDPELIIAEDYDLWLSLSDAGIKFKDVNQIFNYAYDQPDSIYRQKKHLMVESLKYIRQKHHIHFQSLDDVEELMNEGNRLKYIENNKMKEIWETQIK